MLSLVVSEFLFTTYRSDDVGVQPCLHLEGLHMVGALLADQDVLQHIPLGLLNQLLQGGLVVPVPAPALQFLQIAPHEGPRDALNLFGVK